MGIANLHEDIIQTHILTRLDGRSLAAAGCASSHLQSLCSDENLWSEICSSNWPSTQHPLVTQTIRHFTSGHRSFFSDAFSSPSHRHNTVAPSSSPPTTHIISCVDLKYHDQIVFCKVESANTTPTDWFKSSPFRIDLLEPKELVQSALKFSGDDRTILISDLEQHMTLSWILIDPIQNRAVNLSSVKPVSVQHNWMTEELELTFAVVTTVRQHDDDDDDCVNCNVEITCGVNGSSSELNVSGVSLTVQDVDGKCLNGKDSMVVLRGLVTAEMRRCCGGGEWQKERYGEYVKWRKERREKMERRERRFDLVCVVGGLTFLMVFWSLALC